MPELLSQRDYSNIPWPHYLNLWPRYYDHLTVEHYIWQEIKRTLIAPLLVATSFLLLHISRCISVPPFGWKENKPLCIYKTSKKVRHISQTQPCSGGRTCSRPGPSNSCCVLLSPGECLPRVGDRGHGRWVEGLMGKQRPLGTHYDN